MNTSILQMPGVIIFFHFLHFFRRSSAIRQYLTVNWLGTTENMTIISTSNSTGRATSGNGGSRFASALDRANPKLAPTSQG